MYSRWLILAVGCLAVLSVTADAGACTVWQTESGVDLHFPPGVVEFYVQSAGTLDVEGDGEIAAIQAAFAAWGGAQCDGPGPSVEFVYAGTIDVEQTNYDPRLFRDRKNMVTFVQNNWDGDPLVLARARILWDDETGEILEFGIALNDTNTLWSASDEVKPGHYDVQSVVARQIGFSVGMGDSEVTGSVMASGYSEGVADRRGLHGDDEQGFCELYADDRDHSVIPEDAECGRDLHPGLQVSANNDEDPVEGAGAGMQDQVEGRACSQDRDCIEGLECGCREENCVANVCHTPVVDEPAPPSPPSDGCGTTLGTPSWGPLQLIAWMVR
jgi:hypothetical protein